MKKLSVFLLSFLFLAGMAAKDAKPKFRPYSMDKNYFSCQIPADWELQRDEEEDSDYKIYEITLLGPNADKTSINISYYSGENADFKDHKEFIARNTQDGTGRKQSDIGKYGEAKPLTLNGRKAFGISRELKEYASLETKTASSYWLKEKLIVMSAKDGFYVLSYSAKKENYGKYLPVFNSVAKSFKPLY